MRPRLMQAPVKAWSMTAGAVPATRLSTVLAACAPSGEADWQLIRSGTPDGEEQSPAATTRGFGVAEFKQVGGMIAEVLSAIAQSQDGKAPLVEAAIKERVKALTDRFPIYQ